MYVDWVRIFSNIGEDCANIGVNPSGGSGQRESFYITS